MAQAWSAGDWASLLEGDPLGGTTAWASSLQAPFGYARSATSGQPYAPYAIGQSYKPISGFTSQIRAANIQEWLRQEHPENYQFFTNQYGGESTVGRVATGTEWFASGNFDSTADAYIQQSAQKWGVPPNFLKTIIAKESTGNWARDGGRYVYLSHPDRQYYILPYIGMTDPATRNMGVENPRSLVGNQAGQIDVLAKQLRSLYDTPGVGEQYGWKGVSNLHYSGDPSGNTNPQGWEEHGTTRQYTATVMDWWRELDAYAGNQPGTFEPGALPENPRIPTGEGNLTRVDAIWGGIPGIGGVSQPLGRTGWSTGPGAGYYENSYLVGHPQGHTGIDHSMPSGTRLFSPVGGKVIAAGGTGYFRDENYGNAPQTGELRIQLDNGDELILGHMSQIYVQMHQRVNPGDFVGLSGFAGSGDHLHLEYRTPGDTPSGWLAIDPDKALAGAFAGSFQQFQSDAGIPGITQPMTFADLMRAGATGNAIYGGATMGTGSGWHDWLRASMFPNDDIAYRQRPTGGELYGDASIYQPSGPNG